MNKKDCILYNDPTEYIFFSDRLRELFRENNIRVTASTERWFKKQFKSGNRDPKRVLTKYILNKDLRKEIETDVSEPSITKMIAKNDRFEFKNKEIIDVDAISDGEQDEPKKENEYKSVDDDTSDFDIMCKVMRDRSRYVEERSKTYVYPNDIYRFTEEEDQDYRRRYFATASEIVHDPRLPLDILLPAVKYFESVTDIVNFMKTTRANGRLISMLWYNPVGDVSMDFFPNLNTQVFYSPEQYITNKTNKSYKDIIWYPEYSANVTQYDQDKTVFMNIRYRASEEEKSRTFYSVPHNVRSLDKYCFSESKIEHIKLNNVRTLSMCCFSSSHLTEIVIPEGVDVIPESCFMWCVRLTRVVLPTSLKRIEYRAFQFCTELVDIVLPNTIESIGTRAFYGCKKANLNIPAHLKEIDPYSFYSTAIKRAVVPNGVTEIGKWSLSYCDDLMFAHIPNSVVTIYEDAFMVDYSLVVVTCPERHVNTFIRMNLYKLTVIIDTTSGKTYYKVGTPEKAFVTEEELAGNVTYVYSLRDNIRGMLEQCKNLVKNYIPNFVKDGL